MNTKVFIPKHIAHEYRRLLKLSKVSVHTIEIKQVRQAFTIANNACKISAQHQSEPLIMQALYVAQIVASEVGLGTSSVLCALLYKFVENGTINNATIHEQFGEKVSKVTAELAQIALVDTNRTKSQAENFRKLLLTMVSDVRVILIKLADRLYVMRNLEFSSENEQKRIANEAYDLYAPLAHRLGLYPIKTEMEDLAMRYLNPEMYNYIVQKLEDTEDERNRFIKAFVAPINAQMLEQNFNFEIKSRTKSINSIHNKIKKQNVEFEEVYDLFAIRIIINTELKTEKPDCWRAFSIVTGLYQPNPERMRDWISVPKSNGYESLHATVVVPGGKWVEVQIRTLRMDEIAEKGLAAHWKYKGQKADNGLDNWLNQVREALEQLDSDNASLFEDVKLNLYSNEIFVFTPKGDLRKLPSGATLLDFAYDIHSNVGDACIGGRINGKNVPIRYQLNNGDKVEIITSKNQRPKPDWIDFVVTSKAKSKIKLSLKENMLNEAEQGKEIFQRRLRNWKIPFSDLLVTRLLKYFKLKTSVDFYYKIATEEIDLTTYKALITSPEKEESGGVEKIGEAPVEKIIPALSRSEEMLVIDEKMLHNVDYKLARCCNPIFGDDVFGFVTVSEGIKIHRLGCSNATQMTERYSYRIIKARWAGTDSKTLFASDIKISGNNDIGLLAKITDVIAKDLKVNLRSVNVNTNDGIFEGIITVFIKDKEHLETLVHKLAKIKGVNNAHRVN